MSCHVSLPPAVLSFPFHSSTFGASASHLTTPVLEPDNNSVFTTSLAFHPHIRKTFGNSLEQIDTKPSHALNTIFFDRHCVAVLECIVSYWYFRWISRPDVDVSCFRFAKTTRQAVNCLESAELTWKGKVQGSKVCSCDVCTLTLISQYGRLFVFFYFVLQPD